MTSAQKIDLEIWNILGTKRRQKKIIYWYSILMRTPRKFPDLMPPRRMTIEDLVQDRAMRVTPATE